MAMIPEEREMMMRWLERIVFHLRIIVALGGVYVAVLLVQAAVHYS